MAGRRTRSMGVAALMMLGSGVPGFAGDGMPPNWPQQTIYQECVTHSCELVPATRQVKKTVYEVQEVPYCLKKLPPLLSLLHRRHCCDDCGACAECQCPRYKKVLVKKEIVCDEVCTTKCVVREHVERVPCPVCPPCAPACGGK